jgi:hypothetical protein
MGVGALAFVAMVLFLIQYISDATVFGYNPRDAPGWTSLILTILSLSGIQLFGMGILGEYLGRLLEETKRRPAYLVARTLNFEPRPPLEPMQNPADCGRL